MALSTTFGPLTAATGAELDTNFQQVGALTTIQCSATGTNAIVLTPAANQPAVNAYGLPNPLKFGFPAPATTSGSVTLEVSTFGFLPVYTQNGVQATSNTLTSGNYYEVTYTTAALYNSGNGAWVLSSYQPATGLTALSAPSVGGLQILNNAGTPSTKIDVSIGRSCLVSAVGAPAFVSNASFTIDLTVGTVTSTANGMDGESRPASGWVHLYAISTGSGAAGLATTISPISGPPTLPATYSFYAYLGAMRCDGSSNLLRTRQLGSNAQYVVTAATNTAAYPTIASGAVGTFNNTTFTPVAQSVSGFVPTTASKIKFQLMALNSSTVDAAVAPNANFAGYASTTIPVPWFVHGGAAIQSQSQVGEMVLEASTIQYAASAAAGAVFALGWTDYLSAAGG